MLTLMLGAMTMLPQTNALPFLSPVFSSHMVLQRDKPNTFWGWATPGSEVIVTAETKHFKGTADKDGKWMVRFTPPPTGGPYTILIDGTQHAELEDVLVGDVWVCSGQSNMEMGIGNVNNAAAEIAGASNPMIRTCIIPHAISFSPLPTATADWRVCTPESIAKDGWSGFSAVGYFFGRELQKQTHIPIGLVGTYWGGTIAESWISREGVAALGDFNGQLAQIDDQMKAKTGTLEERMVEWFAKNDPGTTQNYQAESTNDSSWKAANLPFSYESVGLNDFDGIMWIRATVTLPSTIPAGEATLSLGAIDDDDTTWVNGVKVGETYSYNQARMYKVPASALKPGVNTIAIRVLDTGVTGGFTSPADAVYLKLGDGQTISLAVPAKYTLGADMKKSTTLPASMNDNPNVVTVLHNGMIHPLAPLAIKGAIWYQGESNGGRGYQYRRVLPAMINDWRKQFGQGDFPFYIVQLANFTAQKPEPGDSDWAEVREAQEMTAINLKNAGMSNTIDIGEAGDIHPKNKQEVGRRLSLIALNKVYGQRVPYSGPTFKSIKHEGDKLRISFDHTDGGLKQIGGDKLLGFSVAGDDHVFHWAQANIEWDTIVVSSKDVPHPIAVRYAWADNPAANLYNGVNLPTNPFRSDDWKVPSFGRK